MTNAVDAPPAEAATFETTAPQASPDVSAQSAPQVGDLVLKYRQILGERAGGVRPISQRAMARMLSELLEPHDRITYATVRNWETGFANPAYWFLFGLIRVCPGWPEDMAREMLARLRPEIWDGGEFHV